MKKGTKILSLAAALTLGVSTLTFTGCGKEGGYQGEETLAQYQAAMANGGEVSSNGGFVVEKGDYVYFINGVESTTANNGYGAPVKGSLMAIRKADLAEGKYDQAKIVIPSLFTAQDFKSGLYIYGDYVYYATPTTDKNVSGETGNSLVDFKRAKLDGTEAPMGGYYLRKPASTVYRFVQVDGVDKNNDNEDDVFCLYEDGTTLKSYNTATGADTVLVKGAADYFYDTNDLTNPNVYYVMSVKYDAEKTNSFDLPYNQIYCVDAAAQIKAVDAGKASYTVAYSDGGEKTYDFDENAMNQNAGARGYNLGDYTTYPYVNLGQLVLDGVGFAHAENTYTHYNEVSKNDITSETAKEAQGYTYAIKRYETSGNYVGLYFTRTANMGNDTAKMFYVEESEALASGWNTVSANNSMDIVAHKATDIPDASIMEIGEKDGKRTYTYMHVATETIGSASNTVINKVTIAQGASYGELTKTSFPMTFDANGATLWKTNGDYLYYYTSGTKGKNLVRINYTGAEDDYNSLISSEEYKPMKVPFVEYNSSWYQPEFVSVNGGELFLYANAQNYGKNAQNYNYVYAAKIGTTAELSTANDEYKEYVDYRTEYESGENADSDVVDLINYLFGSRLNVTEEAKAEYIKKFNKANNDEGSTEGAEFYQAILDKFDESKTDYIKSVAAYTNNISRMTDEDAEKIAEAWDGLLLYPEEEVKAADEGMPTWAVLLIVIGGVIVVAAAISVPVILSCKKKKAAKREADAIVNSYKRQRIDTTDDKTIDVYADEKAAEGTEEPASESAQETEEPVLESASEEMEEVAEAEEAQSDNEEKTE